MYFFGNLFELFHSEMNNFIPSKSNIANFGRWFFVERLKKG